MNRLATATPLLEGLPPVLGPDPRVLVLGSMPGAESLRLQQYYAHPRNHFWLLMQDLLGVAHEQPYGTRVEALKGRGVALWDVLAACVRPGSLDARIDRRSMRTNDIGGLLREHSGLQRILFNGALAEQVFLSRIAAASPLPPGVELVRLPSTSPANASIPYPRKLAAWGRALQRE